MLPQRSGGAARAAMSGTSEWVEAGVLVCRPPNVEGEAPIREYYADMVAKLAERPGPYASITDATNIDRVPNARERKVHGELINAMSKDHSARCRVAVTVMPSTIVRAAITALTWLMDQPIPIHTVATMDEALALARRELGRDR